MAWLLAPPASIFADRLRRLLSPRRDCLVAWASVSAASAEFRRLARLGSRGFALLDRFSDVGLMIAHLGHDGLQLFAPLDFQRIADRFLVDDGPRAQFGELRCQPLAFLPVLPDFLHQLIVTLQELEPPCARALELLLQHFNFQMERTHLRASRFALRDRIADVILVIGSQVVDYCLQLVAPLEIDAFPQRLLDDRLRANLLERSRVGK